MAPIPSEWRDTLKPVFLRKIRGFLFDNLLDRDDYVEVVTLVQKGNTQALQNRCNVFNKFPMLFLVRYLFLDRQPCRSNTTSGRGKSHAWADEDPIQYLTFAQNISYFISSTTSDI